MTIPVNAGDLRQRVTIQAPPAPETPANAFNEPSGTWTNLVTVWASIEPLSGREVFLAAQMQTNVSHKITIRFTPTVSAAYRIVYGSRVFYIRSVLRLPADRPIYLELQCEEDTRTPLRTLTITPTTLPTGTLGVTYSQQLTAVGAVGSVVFTVAAGALPPGVNLSPGGLLSGTPLGAELGVSMLVLERPTKLRERMRRRDMPGLRVSYASGVGVRSASVTLPIAALVSGVDYPADNPAAPAGWDVFVPPASVFSPGSTCPQICTATVKGAPGNVLSLPGYQYTSGTVFPVYGQTKAGNGVLRNATVPSSAWLSTSPPIADVVIDPGQVANSMYLVWPSNGNGVGMPIAINKAIAEQAFFTPSATLQGRGAGVAGEVMTCTGKNLADVQRATSAPITIGTPNGSGGNAGKYVLTVPAGLNYATGQSLICNVYTYTAPSPLNTTTTGPLLGSVRGTVASYSGTTLVLTPVATTGNGVVSSLWDVVACWVWWTDGTTGQWLTPVEANACHVNFAVPSVTTGLAYQVWLHNGHGGAYGWASKLTPWVTTADWASPTVKNLSDYPNDGSFGGVSGCGLPNSGLDCLPAIKWAISFGGYGVKIVFQHGVYLYGDNGAGGGTPYNLVAGGNFPIWLCGDPSLGSTLQPFGSFNANVFLTFSSGNAKVTDFTVDTTGATLTGGGTGGRAISGAAFGKNLTCTCRNGTGGGPGSTVDISAGSVNSYWKNCTINGQGFQGGIASVALSSGQVVIDGEPFFGTADNSGNIPSEAMIYPTYHINGLYVNACVAQHLASKTTHTSTTSINVDSLHTYDTLSLTTQTGLTDMPEGNYLTIYGPTNGAANRNQASVTGAIHNYNSGTGAFQLVPLPLQFPLLKVFGGGTGNAWTFNSTDRKDYSAGRLFFSENANIMNATFNGCQTINFSVMPWQQDPNKGENINFESIGTDQAIGVASATATTVTTYDSRFLNVDATGGTFTLTFGGNTTTALAFNASPATIQAALAALASIGNGNVSVRGGLGGAGGLNPYVIEFAGSLTGYQGSITPNSGGMTGGGGAATVSTSIASQHPYVLCVSNGKGLSQNAAILSVSGLTYTLQTPLRIVPDTTSRVTVGSLPQNINVHKASFAGNSFFQQGDQYAPWGIGAAANLGFAAFVGAVNVCVSDCDFSAYMHGFQTWSGGGVVSASPAWGHLYEDIRLTGCGTGMSFADGGGVPGGEFASIASCVYRNIQAPTLYNVVPSSRACGGGRRERARWHLRHERL